MAHIFNRFKYLCLILIFGSVPLVASPTAARDWGQLMVAPEKTNIRSDRSPRAKITGQLEAGERIRADFLKNGWYAVFDSKEKRRQERRARGYVYAPRLLAVASPARKLLKKAVTVPAQARHGKPASGKKPKAGTETSRSTAGSASEDIQAEKQIAPEQAIPTPAPVPEPAPATGRVTAQASLREPDATPQRENTPSFHPEAGATIKNISVKFGPAGHERVFVDFNQDVTPEIFSIEGEKPRIVLDISNVQSVRPGLTRIKTRGRLIRQIRSSLDAVSRRMRIVVDLAPAMNYKVEPAFYKLEKIYLLDISEASSDAP